MTGKTRPQAPVFKHGDKGAGDFNRRVFMILYF